MKKLKLQNDSYRILVSNYKEWLDILGYAETTVYNLPNHLREFFYWLESQERTDINHITTQDVTNYYKVLKERSNQRIDGALSKSYLNKHQQALKKFKEYLQNHNHQGINIHLKSESQPTEEKRKCIRIRDKALLTIFYSCGLRRNEAVHLDIKDVLFEKERIYVRKGKNYKERFVPINKYNLSILEDYIYDGRPDFNIKDNTEALLLNQHGTRLQGMSFANRLQAIVAATENKIIIEKNITPHTLRHSIATHLLQKEVPLESIKHFLGHSSLESTQIYTHLLKTIKHENI